MTRAEPASRFQVLDWVVDPTIDEVSLRGVVTKLEPRMMRLLVCLARAAGQVVSFQRLLDEVWGDVVVSPASVYQSVSQLRKILGDTDATPAYIATVPRKGYRLVAPVRWLESTSSPPASVNGAHPDPPALAPEAAHAATGPPLLQPRNLLLAAGLVFLVALTAVLWQVSGHRSSAPSASPSIAVLPFVDMTAEQRDQPFCDGLSEELSNWLAQIPALRVVARTSAFAFRGRSADVRRIGKELGATHILEGSVRRSRDRVRVTAELIDASNGYHLRSMSIDRPFTDVIRIQDEIARAVTAAFEISLSNEAAKRLVARGAVTAQAYELYLLGRHYQDQRTVETNARAIELYSRAIEADRNFALAYVGSADAILAQRLLSDRPLPDVAAQMMPLLSRAFELNPALPEAYTTRAALRTAQSRLGEAFADLTRAIQLNPNSADAAIALARLFRQRGQPRDALASFERAVQLDPVDFLPHVERCVALQDLGRFDDAVTACARARELDTDGPWGLRATAWLAEAQGKLDEAIEWTNRALLAAPNDVTLYQMRAGYCLSLGLARMARETYERTRKLSNDIEQLDAQLADVVFLEGGTAALRAHLARTDFVHSTRAGILLTAARLQLLVNDVAAARHLTDRALAAADFDATQLTDPWSLRWGYADAVIVALAELRTGDSKRAEARLRELAATLDRLERNGQVGYGLHVARAEVLALQSNSDAAMASLRQAVTLGWRGALFSKSEPQFASLRARGDFQALLEHVARMNELMRSKVPDPN